jgi:hypoxanthine-guanine phosphoribosyltransferase
MKTHNPIIVIAVLEKSVMFSADLQKNFSFKMVPEFIFERDVFKENCEEVSFDLLNFTVLKGQHVLLVSSSLDEKAILPLIVDRINAAGPDSLQTAILLCDNETKFKLKTEHTFIAFNNSTKDLIGYGFGQE